MSNDGEVRTGASGRDYTVKTSAKGIDYVRGVLRERATVTTQAVFWKIPRSSGRSDLSLNLGRYRRRSGELQPVRDSPKSELTLDSEELTALIEFVADNVEPLATPARRYLVLDGSDERRLDIVRQVLDDPDREQLLDVLVRERLVPDDLRRGLEHRARCAAVDEFASLLSGDHAESAWQRWFEHNDWVLGSDFVRVVDERPIDVGHIADYLMEGFDGFLDVVEIKRPGGGLRFWASSRDHGNPIPHTDLIKAITQAHRYLYEIEQEANSLKFVERVGLRAIKPRCTLVFGRSADWDDDERRAYRILNGGYHSLSVLTYDHVLTRARRMLGLAPAAPVR